MKPDMRELVLEHVKRAQTDEIFILRKNETKKKLVLRNLKSSRVSRIETLYFNDVIEGIALIAGHEYHW